MRSVLFFCFIAISTISHADTVWIPVQTSNPYQTTIIVPPEPYVPRIIIRPEFRLTPVVKLMPVRVQTTGPFGRVISESVEMQPFTFWEYTTVYIRVLE